VRAFPSPQTLLIAGAPRSGTTLTCELLNLLPDVRALDEPLRPRALVAASGDGRGGVDADRLAGHIEAFAAEQRQSLRERGEALSKNVDGRVVGAKVSDGRGSDGLRRRLRELGPVHLGTPAADPFLLAIKQPMAFTALLPLLAPRFPTVAIVRNPLATLASWESVPMKVRDGRSGMPEAIAPGLAAQLAAEPDRLERQLILLDWLWEHIAALPPERVVRYEDIVRSGGAALAPVAASAAGLRVALVDRNASLQAPPDHVAAVGERLLARDGAYWRWYAPAVVRELARAARATPPARRAACP